MKTSKILLQSDDINKEETPKKVLAGKLLVIFMLLWMTLLTSCIAFIPVGHGHGGHERHEHHD